jgi:pseudaminic acid synthase
MTAEISINGRRIGPGHPTYIVAEMSANHGGRIDRAIRIVEAAKLAGADAVKLQTYSPDTMTIDCDNPRFRINGTLWEGRSLYDLYREAATPWDWLPELQRVARDLEIDLFSTAFDATAVAFLEGHNAPVYKIASFEAVDIPLLETVARTGKPVIMSTGMASLAEIEEAVHALRGNGNRQLALLRCVSAYPAPAGEMNLRTIPDLARAFNVVTGLSDHSMNAGISAAAVALGASIVEKHFTLSRQEPGPDSAFSLEPAEFREMAEAVRAVESALGEVRYGAGEQESKSSVFRRSLFIVRDTQEGEVFTAENVRVIRPGFGLHSRHLHEVLGRRAACDIPRGTPLSWDLVEGTGS